MNLALSKTRIHSFIPFLLTLFLFFYCWNTYWGGKRWQTFFLSDSNGYFAYLPATFIYHDFNFSFFDDVSKKYFSAHDNFDIRSYHKGNAIDKYNCGTALALAPFFFIGHALTLTRGTDADGYTFWYAWGLSIAALFYCFIGLWSLRKILLSFFENESMVTVLLILTLFATNLFYYSTSEPAMSHVYSFAFINLFVLSVIKYFETRQQKFVLFSFAILAIIILIRPINVIVIGLIPFLAGTKERLKSLLEEFWRMRKIVLIGFIIFSLILFIQMIFYKLETGKFFIYSYGNEKLDLSKPHLVNFLFSYQKGLFVYLPLIFLSLFGLIFLFRKNKFQFYSLAIFVFALWYIFSSWWIWSYGGSFGSRPIVEFLFVFAFLLGNVFKYLSGMKKKIFVTFCFFCLLVCQVQTYQYRYYFIHWNEMTKERYWKVFMRVDLILKKENPNADLLK